MSLTYPEKKPACNGKLKPRIINIQIYFPLTLQISILATGKSTLNIFAEPQDTTIVPSMARALNTHETEKFNLALVDTQP